MYETNTDNRYVKYVRDAYKDLEKNIKTYIDGYYFDKYVNALEVVNKQLSYFSTLDLSRAEYLYRIEQNIKNLETAWTVFKDRNTHGGFYFDIEMDEFSLYNNIVQSSVSLVLKHRFKNYRKRLVQSSIFYINKHGIKIESDRMFKYNAAALAYYLAGGQLFGIPVHKLMFYENKFYDYSGDHAIASIFEDYANLGNGYFDLFMKYVDAKITILYQSMKNELAHYAKSYHIINTEGKACNINYLFLSDYLMRIDNDLYNRRFEIIQQYEPYEILSRMLEDMHGVFIDYADNLSKDPFDDKTQLNVFKHTGICNDSIDISIQYVHTNGKSFAKSNTEVSSDRGDFLHWHSGDRLYLDRISGANLVANLLKFALQ